MAADDGVGTLGETGMVTEGSAESSFCIGKGSSQSGASSDSGITIGSSSLHTK